jgi:taurine dioxygenase
MVRAGWEPRALAPSFGVELKLDVTTLDSDGARDLLVALRRHKLLLVRGQSPDEDAYVRLGAALGRLWSVSGQLSGNRESPHAVSDRVEIARVSNQGGMLENRAIDWHSDLAHHPSKPYPGRILYSKAMPSDAVSVTSWVDLEYGWKELLSHEQRRLLGGKRGEYQAGYETEWGRTQHDVVRRHPVREGEWLSVDRAFFRGFVDMDEEASAALKRQLLSRLIASSAMYRHVWQQGDVVIYDNEGTMHRREKVRSTQERTIWRLTLEYAWESIDAQASGAVGEADHAGNVEREADRSRWAATAKG